MKKPRARVLSSAIVATMILGTAFPAVAFAETTGGTVETKSAVERLYGATRYETAANVAMEGWDTSKVAILAPGMDENLVDALTAAPFAKSIDAPILLTEGSKLPDATLEALEKLGVEEVYTVSGVIKKDAILKAFEDKELKITIKGELGGQDRFETAKKIAEQLKDVNGIMVTTAYTYADALSVASIAAAKNMPILLADQDGLPKVEADYLAEIKDQVKATYVLGGEALVSEAVYDKLPGEDGEGKTRIFGKDRFATNLEVLKKFPDLKYDKVFVANGQDSHLVDALVVAALAAKTDSPIVLADNELSKDVENYLLPKLKANSIVALGGSSVVADKALNYNHVRPQDFAVMQLSGVNGYNVGFEVVDGKTASDLEKVEVTLYKGDTVLAKNTSLNKLFNEYPTATQLSTPFNIDGNFNGDGYWIYGGFNGTVLDIPTKTVIKVTYLNGTIYEVENTNLAGNPEDLNKEALNHVKPAEFGVMQFSGINGYSVGFSLVDKDTTDLESIEVSLYTEDEEENDVLLVTNTATRKNNRQLFELKAKNLSTPFNIDGPFENDAYWTYGDFNGTVEDIPTKAVITILYQDGRKFSVQNTDLTGDTNLLGAPSITSDLAAELVKGETVEFNVTTALNSFVVAPEAADTKVLVKLTLTDGNQEDVAIQYLEIKDGKYMPLTLDENGIAFYGPQTGFPFMNGTSKFNATFNKVGTYAYTLEVITAVADDEKSEVLAMYEGQVEVKEAEGATEETTENQ
jgi:putative cell wall-binding protein